MLRSICEKLVWDVVEEFLFIFSTPSDESTIALMAEKQGLFLEQLITLFLREIYLQCNFAY